MIGKMYIILKLIDMKMTRWMKWDVLILFLLFCPAISSSFYDEVLIRIENPMRRNLELNGVSIGYITGYSRLGFEDLKELMKDKTEWMIEGKEYAGFLEFSCTKAECLMDSPVSFYLFIKGRRTRVLKLEFKSLDEISRIGRIDGITMKYENFFAQLGALRSDGSEFSFYGDGKRMEVIRRDRVDKTEFGVEYEE
jgi:hypothetical protein